MSNASRDDNRIPTMLGTSSVDGVTPVPLTVTKNRLNCADGTTGSNLPFVNSERDQNRVPTIWGVSSADGVTPIPIYTDSNGNLLIKTT